MKEEGARVKLSRRLAALSEWVPEGARLADIGTDHALLPVYLAGSGRIRFAVAGDVNAGPVEAARRQVAEAGLADTVSVRHGDGLSVLAPGEVDTVCIAGMGGSLMARLLEAAGERLNGVRTLVLSPHVAEDAVRRWLIENGYLLDREQLLEEDGVIYTLLRAVRPADRSEAERENRNLYDEKVLAPCVPSMKLQLLLEMGPLLVRRGGAEFRRKWRQEIAKREQIIAQMGRSSAEGAADKIRQWETAVAEIREVLACLPEEKP
ncbi:tRNA (adenine-N(1))-methyltransferase [Cohnella sp. CFH 77786]|nr:tRNA (adenine-N(1))-methyltransferase [Cohnella sp. CFH 77786]